MCCLGVYLEACGFKKDDMKYICTPKRLPDINHLPLWLKSYDGKCKEDASNLMSVNDESIIDTETYEHYKLENRLSVYHHTSEEEREEKVVALFKKNGVTVNIVD